LAILGIVNIIAGTVFTANLMGEFDDAVSEKPKEIFPVFGALFVRAGDEGVFLFHIFFFGILLV